MSPTIHLMRHAQAAHNIGRRWHLLDPDLTESGEIQCFEFNDNNTSLQQRITHLVSSPSYRCIRTALLSFGQVSMGGTLVQINPDMQEVAPDPCNIPRDQEDLEDLADDYIDTKLLDNVNYTDRGPTSPFRYNMECVIERARKSRVWLRETARQYRAENDSDSEIVVVSHIGFLTFLAQGNSKPWFNCQVRSFKFVDPNGDDDQAYLELIDDDLDDSDSSTGPSGADGGVEPPRGILKRRRDDNDDGQNGPSSTKRAKRVGWAENLEQIRVFSSFNLNVNKLRRGVSRALIRAKHPSVSIQFSKSDFSSIMLRRARQIQRFADRFPDAELFSTTTINQARAVQPTPWKNIQANEDEWPTNWNPTGEKAKRSIGAFLGHWDKLFPHEQPA